MEIVITRLGNATPVRLGNATPVHINQVNDNGITVLMFQQLLEFRGFLGIGPQHVFQDEDTAVVQIFLRPAD